jgi:hypothetical protein
MSLQKEEQGKGGCPTSLGTSLCLPRGRGQIKACPRLHKMMVETVGSSHDRRDLGWTEEELPGKED